MTPDLLLLRPEGVLAGGLLLVLLADLLLPPHRRGLASWLGVLACGLALLPAATAATGTIGSMLAIDALVTLARPAILFATALLLLAGHGEHGRERDHGAFTSAVLGLGLGALVTAAAASLITLLLGVELMSLCGYVLAAWRGGDRRAAEAGMKYVLFGGVATGLSLFGMSHVYGLTGHLDFAGIGSVLATGMPLPAVAALALAAVGLLYKLSIVPFHFYAPDVYQGAPAIPVAAIGVLPKLAATAALVRLLALAAPASLVTPAALSFAITGAAVASFLLASFTALAQRDAKRIVAFSAIGHAGTVLLAVACMPGAGLRDPGAVAAAAFYLAGYAVANLGALVCLAVFERERGASTLPLLAGAMRQRPWLTAALCLFLFSLAGLPPLAGFAGKWGVLRQALGLGLSLPDRSYLLWAALALVASTAISAWAYLLIIRAAVLLPAPAAPEAASPRLPIATVAVLLLCAIATVGLGLWFDGFGSIARVLGG